MSDTDDVQDFDDDWAPTEDDDGTGSDDDGDGTEGGPADNTDDIHDTDDVHGGLDPAEADFGDGGLLASSGGEDRTDEASYFGGCCAPSDRSPGDLPGAEGWAPNGNLIVANPDGTTADFGPPTLDLDGDGTPDSALVSGPDGAAYVVVDFSGDFVLDGVLVVDGSGDVLAGFELDADGQPTEIAVPDDASIADQLGLDPSGGVPGPATTLEPDPTPVPAPGQPDERDPVIDLGAPGKNVVLNDGGKLVDLGAPTLDLDGDGVPDAVVVNDDLGRPAYVVMEISAATPTW